MPSTRRHLSFANVVSLCALFVALGGVSYAAVALPKNSVGKRQIRADAVRTAEVKDATLRLRDLKPATAASIQRPDAYARVQPDGTLLPRIGDEAPEPSFGIGADMVERPAAGTYCLKGLSGEVASAMVAPDNAGASAAADNDVLVSVAVDRGSGLAGCETEPATQVRVLTTEIDPAAPAAAPADKGFVVWVELEDAES